MMKVLCSSSILFASFLLFLLISQGEAGFRVRRRRRRSPPPNQRPRFTYCPPSRTIRTTALETVISWSPPIATDENSTPTVTRTTGPASGSIRRSGSYGISYSARDSHGATAACSFTMTVDVIRCPNIVAPSNSLHSCTYGVQGGSQCTFTCRHGYRLIGGATVLCNSNTRRWSSSFPTCQDQPPIFTYCPPSRTIRTTALETIISWSPPTATDGNSSPTVTQTAGPAYGSIQLAGSYPVSYSARDSNGATASCSFTMTIDVIRCPNIVAPSNSLHSCTYGVQGGSQCTFTCQHGYRLIGGATIHCNSATRQWSSSFPTCQEMTCNPSLPSPAYGSISCTNGNRFMSMCFFDCNEGYEIPTGQISARYCNGHSWSGQQPTCQDIKPPEFTSCPTSFDVNVNVESSNSDNAVITYNAPRAVDNSGHVSLSRVLGKASGSQFESGTNTIKYRAEDGAGNIMECNFTINVVIIVVAG